MMQTWVARLGRAGGSSWSAAATAHRICSAGSLLLLLAAACVPGEGPRPPLEVLPPVSGGSGNYAGVSGGVTVPPAGTAGTGAVAGTQAPPAVDGSIVPIGGTGVAGGAGAAGGPMPIAGTNAPAPGPDAGAAAFNPGTDPNRNLVQPGAICDRMTTLQCAAEAFCCSNPRRTTAVCKTELMAECTTTLFVDDIAKNAAVGYSVMHTKAAFDQLEQLAAVCDPSAAVWSVSTDGFRGIFQGTIPPGGDCKPSGLPSTVRYGAALASCTQPATHACLFIGDTPTPTSATCQPRSTAGGPCFWDPNCQHGLYCANPEGTYSGGVCTAPKPAGAACSESNECTTQICTSGACAASSADGAYCLKP